MRKENRRFFRINETIGLSYEVAERGSKSKEKTVDIMDIMSEQDEKIEKLLMEVAEESPKVAELVQVFNQKLERVVEQLALDSRMVDKLANRVQEVNISACGLGYTCEESIEVGSQLNLKLELYPSKKMIHVGGIVVGCDPVERGHYWRIDFYGMSHDTQEMLIQHIVQRQSAQLYMKDNS